LETTGEGLNAALGIESEDASTTILEFPPKALFEPHDALAKISPALAVEPFGPARSRLSLRRCARRESSSRRAA